MIQMISMMHMKQELRLNLLYLTRNIHKKQKITQFIKFNKL